MTSKSPTTLEPDAGSPAKGSVLATVTGVDSGGQLFRDAASIVFLKQRKCIYLSKYKPSLDSSVMIEIRSGKQAWRSDAKIRGTLPAGADGLFRVTVELDQGYDTAIEAVEDTAPVSVSEAPGDAPRATVASSPGAKFAGKAHTAPAGKEDAPEFGIAADDHPAKPAPAPAAPLAPTPTARMMVAEAVRSAVASELESLRSELQGAIAGEAAATKKSIELIEAKIEQSLRKPPALSEDSVRKIAAQAAENAQIEWATTSQKIVAEAVRSAMASEGDRQRQELRTLVSGEIEAALRGPLGARLDDKVKTSVEAGIEESFRKRPGITEDRVRHLAAQAAENIQLEWASTKMQKIVAEAVRSAIASESGQRRAETTAMVSGEIEAAVRGPLAARMDAAIEKTVVQRIEDYFRTPSFTGALNQLVVEAVRRPLEAEYEQRGRQVQAVVSHEIEAAVRGPIASQMDEMLHRALEAQRAEYLRTPPPITEETLRQITAGIAGHPQLQGSIDALAATLTERWTEIARGATTNVQEDIHSRVAATERLANQVLVDIQQKLDSFNAEMNRILGNQGAGSPSEDGSPPPDGPDRDKDFRELLRSTGSHFEREMKAALQKIFGKS